MARFGTNNNKMRSKLGQHTIEYVTILTLVMVGVLIMEKYVVRSWNANLKGWEDSVHGSLEDTLPSGSIAFAGCDLDPWVNDTCGPRDRHRFRRAPRPRPYRPGRYCYHS